MKEYYRECMQQSGLDQPVLTKLACLGSDGMDGQARSSGSETDVTAANYS